MSSGAKPIKSAQRVFEVLEYFDEDHQEASVGDISRRFGYPQSSASELISYMIDLGYLRRGSRYRTFRLSMRVAMLGSWVQPDLFRHGHLLKLMDQLGTDTGGSVVLATNDRVRVQCLHSVQGNVPAPRQGQVLPLLQSAEGRALLLGTDRSLVKRYVHRLNAEAELFERVRFEDLAADLNASSDRGYVRMLSDEGLSVAMLLPNADQAEPLTIAVRTSGRKQEEATVRLMRSHITRTLGLMSVPAPRPPLETARLGFARRSL